MTAGQVVYWVEEDRTDRPFSATARVRSGRVMAELGGTVTVLLDGPLPAAATGVAFVPGDRLYADASRADVWAYGDAHRLLKAFGYKAVEVTDHTGRTETVKE